MAKPKTSLQSLLEQQKQLAEQIAELQATERAEFKARVEEEAAALGLNCFEIWSTGFGKRSKAKNSDAQRAPAAPKYRSLKNPADVWSGRGREPRWMQAEMTENKRLKKENFLIEQRSEAA